MKTHGIMFHHFHGEGHPRGQGSLSAKDIREMLGYLRRHYSILNARDFLAAVLEGRLEDDDTCLTFDDSLLCQYDLAAPVLEEEGLTGFFFVYSSAFSDSPDRLEVYRYFRSTEYSDFDEFSADFMDSAASLYGRQLEEALIGFEPDEYMPECPFYSRNDRLFRYVRDCILMVQQYDEIMDRLMYVHGFEAALALPNILMSPKHLLDLHKRGHVIGLHSHSHPLNMDRLSPDDQRAEYVANYDFLESILGEAPQAMSHPMGRYNEDTLAILADLGIAVGFLADMGKAIGFGSSLGITRAPSLLETPREDHANILERMRK